MKRTISKMNVLVLLAGLLAAACELPESDDKRDCVTPADCLGQEVCIKGQCLTSIPTERYAFLSLMAERECTKVNDCCHVSQDYLVVCEARVSLELDKRLPPGKIVRDEAAARRCLQGIEVFPCDLPQEKNTPWDLFVTAEYAADCRSLFSGTLDIGDSCIPPPTSTDLCGADAVCAQVSEGDWECVQKQGNGGNCLIEKFPGDEFCDDYHWCDWNDDRCHPKRAVGDNCVDEHECLSYSCDQGACIAFRTTDNCSNIPQDPWSNQVEFCDNAGELICAKIFLCLTPEAIAEKACGSFSDYEHCANKVDQECMASLPSELPLNSKQCMLDLMQRSCIDLGGFADLATDFPASCANFKVLEDVLSCG